MTFISDQKTEEKVKEKLIYDAQSKKKVDSAKKNDKLLNNLEWKLKEMVYQQEVDKVTKQVSDRMMVTFETWNKKRVQLVKEKTESEIIEQEKKVFYDQENSDITDILNGFGPTIEEYILDAQTLKPKLAKQLTVENQKNLIMTNAQDDFLKRVELQMALVKMLAKQLAQMQKLQFDQNILSQKLADIPLMIDEKIQEVKEILDMLLGKLLLPMFQPDLPDFNIDALINLLMGFINPVIAATTPLSAIVGKIPILGDIMGIMSMMRKSSGSGQGAMSKEEIEKLLPKPPSIPEEMLDKLGQIKDDIIVFCMTLPTILIQVVMSMIDLIYSKLSIITSIIPLGSMFPLSLIPTAINAGPKILALIKVLPGMLYDLIKGVIVNKLKEAWALTFARPNNVDWETILGLAQERVANKKAEKKKSYSDVTDEIYKSSLEKMGYTKLQAKNIQTNYKKIYNGTDSLQPKITKFTDNGKEQDLPRSTMLGSLGSNLASSGLGLVDTMSQSLNVATSLGAGAINAVSFGTAGLEGTNITNFNTAKTSEDAQTEEADKSQNIEYGVDESQITRKKPSVEDYEAYFKKLISESDLATGLKYERIKKTQGVVGEWYQTFQPQLKKYGEEIVIEDVMEPALSSTSYAIMSNIGAVMNNVMTLGMSDQKL